MSRELHAVGVHLVWWGSELVIFVSSTQMVRHKHRMMGVWRVYPI